MSFVLQIVGFANGEPCPHAGHYVESFDHDASEGHGFGVFTPDIRGAMQFATAGEAWDFWRRQSRVNRWRPDGRPNRPLTASTVTIERVLP
jgi:hypothetical protein